MDRKMISRPLWIAGIIGLGFAWRGWAMSPYTSPLGSEGGNARMIEAIVQGALVGFIAYLVARAWQARRKP